MFDRPAARFDGRAARGYRRLVCKRFSPLCKVGRDGAVCLDPDISVEWKHVKSFCRKFMTRPSVDSKPEPRRVLTGAVLRASALLEITQSSLAQILGLSPSTVSRMANGTYTLDDQKKEWELGALFVRLFRSLDAVIGSNDAAARSWLNGENHGLVGRPIDLIQSTEGLVRVVQYLDCARGRI
jgi:transcriptional regulator with XRE-family HTH domain